MADSDIVVSGLETAPGISYNALTYETDDPHEGGLLNQSLDVVEIWASQTNDRATATKVREGNKTNALHVALGNGETWYYWIKARNKQGYFGEWYPISSTSGIIGTTALIAADDAVHVTDLLLASDGYIVLEPSGLVIEWGTDNTDSSGVVTVQYQKLTLNLFPWSIVALPSAPSLASNTEYSVTVKDLTISPPDVTHHLDVRKNVSGTVTAAPSGIPVFWLAIGFPSS